MVFLDVVEEFAALDSFHDDVHVVPGLYDVLHFDDIGVLYSLENLYFVSEEFALLGREVFLVDHFNCHEVERADVASQVDRAELALAEHVEFVVLRRDLRALGFTLDSPNPHVRSGGVLVVEGLRPQQVAVVVDGEAAHSRLGRRLLHVQAVQVYHIYTQLHLILLEGTLEY